MVNPPHLWLWFPHSSRWVPATPAGAQVGFVQYGQDTAWGVRQPNRPGMDPVDFAPLYRLTRWNKFLALTQAQPHARHRIAVV